MSAMRALSLIRGRKGHFLPPSVHLDEKNQATSANEEVTPRVNALVWQPRPEWLRKPRARQNLWN